MAEFFETEVDDLSRRHRHGGERALRVDPLRRPTARSTARTISHLHSSECGGTEFWSGGNARSVPVPTVDGKISVATLVETIEAGALRAADPPGRALSITQGTEAGTVYTVREVRELAAAARAKGLLVHMDGARFANAVARLGCTPAELTWKAGRRRPVVRRDEERSALRRGRRLLQPRPRRDDALPPAPGRPSLLEDALPLGPAGRLPRGRPLAPQRPPRERDGRARAPGAGRPPGRPVPPPDGDQLRAGGAPEAGVGRPGRRRLQLLPARRAPGRASSGSRAPATRRPRRWTR